MTDIADNIQTLAKDKRAPLFIAGAVGVGLFWYWQKGKQAPEVTEEVEAQVDPGFTPRYPPGSAGPTVDDTNDNPTGKPRTNSEWVRQGTQWLIGRAVDGSAAQTALQKYVDGASVSTGEKALVNLVIGALGPAPEYVPPVTNNPVPVPPAPKPRTTRTKIGNSVHGDLKNWGLTWARFVQLNPPTGARWAMVHFKNPNTHPPRWKQVITVRIG